MMRNKTIAVLACFACLIAACGKQAPAQPSPEIQAMMKNAKTFCVGRYLIDLPADAVFVDQLDKYGLFEIDHKKVESGSFSEVIAKRTAELNDDIDVKEGKWKVIVTPLREGRAVLFQYGGLTLGDQIFKLEGYIRLGGYDIRFLKRGLPVAYLAEEKQKLERILTTIQPRHPNQIFTKPGMCIERAFIPDDGPPEDERREFAMGVFRLAGYPDVQMEFTVNTQEEPDLPLLDRGRNLLIPPALQDLFSQIDTIRRGERKVGILQGQEILSSLPAPEGGRNHNFIWEAEGKPHNVEEQDVNLEFRTGLNADFKQRLPSVLPEKQAVELFDQIVNTIRKRPLGTDVPADGQQNPAAKPAAAIPLGTKADSWAVCPQTGIWECAEPTLAYGERRRRLEAGQRMPIVAVMADAQRGLAKWLGQKEENAIDTTWTLVAYDEQAQG